MQLFLADPRLGAGPSYVFGVFCLVVDRLRWELKGTFILFFVRALAVFVCLCACVSPFL
jgi:hypothetical protein